MSEAKCSECRWVYVSDDEVKQYNCLNPLNDLLYNWFNTSTGDVVKNIRRSVEVEPDEVCDEFSQWFPKTEAASK